MSKDLTPIRSKVRQFIAEYGESKGVAEIADEDSLMKRNVVDSLGVFRLIAFLEEAFPLTIDDVDIAPENFETIDLIVGFVARKILAEEPGAAVPISEQPAELANA